MNLLFNPVKDIEQHKEFHIVKNLIVPMYFKGGSTKTVSNISKEQKKTLNQAMQMLQSGMSKGASAYGGQLVADTPDLFTKAYEDFTNSQGAGLDNANTALDRLIKGTPAYEYDPEALAKSWKKDYATPIMNTWNDVLRPMIDESYNLPGVANSTIRSRGLAKAANDFYGGNVAPTLFSAQQNALGLGVQSQMAANQLIMPAVQMRTQLPYQQFLNASGAAGQAMGLQQNQLSSKYQEFLRMAGENNPYLKLALGGATVAGTQDTVINPGQSGAGIGTMIGGGLGAAVGLMGGPFGALQGASIGGALGGNF